MKIRASLLSSAIAAAMFLPTTHVSGQGVTLQGIAGAIVSGNPYCVTMVADKYGEVGLGSERADNMVRLGDFEPTGISYSYHSDMPMEPMFGR